METREHKYLQLKKSGIHNLGAFAKIDIPEGAKIIEYVGEKITKEEAERREKLHEENAKKDPSKGMVYVFELDDEYDIDGDVPYNDAKFFNHSCDPNCEYSFIDGHIWIVASRNIKKGEELTYNYGFDYDDYEKYPCKCGAKNCVGYILDEDHWHKVKKKG